MSTRGWFALTVLLFGLISAGSAFAVEIGTEPPDFTLKSLAGETVTLSDYRGKTIILKLATTWCSGCRQQEKEISGIEAFLAEHEVVLIEVFVDQEPEAAVRDYLQQRHSAPPSITLIDDGSAARAYRLLGIPWVLLIDRDFTVRRERGLITAADLQSQLQKMLKK